MSESTEMTTLRIRNLIAAREANTSQANMELMTGGSWLCDHAQIDQEIAAEIDALLGERRVSIKWKCPKCRHAHAWTWDRDDVTAGEVWMCCDKCHKKTLFLMGANGECWASRVTP